MKKTIQNPTFQNLLNDFESYVKVKNYKQGKSTTLYQSPVREFLMWLETSGISNIKVVTSKEAVSYLEYLSTRPNQRNKATLADKTIKFHLFALGLFVQNLLENRRIESGFYIPSYNGNLEKPRDILTVDEVKMVYEHCEDDMQRALLSVAYGCGLRRSEITMLNVRDIQFASGLLIVRDGKGNKRREVPMSNTVVGYLKKYLIEERHQKLVGKSHSTDAFFIYNNGQRMSGEYLGDMIKKIMEQTGNYELIKKEITLHCLRHSIASHLADNNAGIDFIQRFLGHVEINTTYIYATKNKKRKPVFF